MAGFHVLVQAESSLLKVVWFKLKPLCLMAARHSLAVIALPDGIPCPPLEKGVASQHEIISGYMLLRRDEAQETPCPGYGRGRVFLSEYDICRTLSAKHAGDVGRPYSMPLKLQFDVNADGRWQLRVNLSGTDGKTHKVSYAHLVACCLLKTSHDKPGRTCKPHYIDAVDWYQYEADHDVVGDQCDCRLAALSLVHEQRHRGERRVGWPSTSLDPAYRGMKRPASALVRARPKAAAKRVRTRAWQ